MRAKRRMGVIRFQLPERKSAPESMLDRTYMAGTDGVPWPCQTHLEGDLLVLSRDIQESGNFYAPWMVEGFGELMLSTGSLMERKGTYDLPVELARGTLNRLRNQLAAWMSSGLKMNDTIQDGVTAAIDTLSKTVTGTCGIDQRTENAGLATRLSVQTMESLVDQYTRQALRVRHAQVTRFPTLFGANLGNQSVHSSWNSNLCTTSNAAVVPMTWNQIESSTGQHAWETTDEQMEWCTANGIRIIGGPLINIDGSGLPDWLILWEDDFDELQSYVTSYVQHVVRRYRNKISLWNCAGRLTAAGSLGITEEQKLQLTVRIIEQIRRSDSRATPIIVTFDQPWAEQIAQNPVELTPLHFASDLARAGLGLSGFGLELNLGYWPGGCNARDLVEISHQLDRWSFFGLPLVVYLTVPSSLEEDAQARHGIQPRSCLNKVVSAETQNSFVERLIPMLLAKPFVHGVIWNQVSDESPHEFPHGGLIDASGAAKPILQTMARIREEHLV